MNMNRNFTQIVAAALLFAALPAGAQVLGGALGGGGSAGLGGTLGQIGGGANGSAFGGINGEGAFGSLRDRTQGAAMRGRDAATGAGAGARTRAQQSRDAVTAAAAGTRHAAGGVSGSVSNAQPAAPAAPTPAASSGDGLFDGGIMADGAASGSAERQAMGRTVNANGGAGGSASADRSGVDLASSHTAGASVKRNAPAPAEPATE
jgi:hypothetical protein